MKKLSIISLAVMLLGITFTAVMAGGGTQTWNFNNEPFTWDQDYTLAQGWGPAFTFGEDVHVHYEALNGDRVKLSADGDLSWVLTQNGTATITALDDDEELHVGNFQVVERGIDLGNDSGCQSSDGHAWLGNCEGLYSTVEFIEYTWLIDGGSTYYYNLSIDAPGQYCFTIGKGSRQDTIQFGNGCDLNGGSGFDEFGYNYNAGIFVGTADGVDRIHDGNVWGDPTYANDMLVMKWNAEWDRGNDEGWSNQPYDAWTSNEWNGMFPGGSGETWHYKIVWVGECGSTGAPLDNGGYCIWGQFAVIMSHGTFDGQHFWDVLGSPAGYGYYP
jgi:hypothetical protein